MKLFLQFGYGMMGHSRSLISTWGSGTVILSPRDLSDDQLKRLADEIRGLPGGQVLLDPQFYLPRANHFRLCEHEYWPRQFETGSFFGGPALAKLIGELKRLNDRLGTFAFLLPGQLASQIDGDWLETQRLVMEEARNQEVARPLWQTIALSDQAAREADRIGALVDFSIDNPADGYYLVLEHPRGAYIVDDANWLANLLDLAAGLKLTGKPVVVGYAHQQMLVCAVAKVDAIASGTWMNVRAFPPDKFRSDGDEDVKQRATWFYCPQALSEYKLPYLDIAFRRQMLQSMLPDTEPVLEEVRQLFQGRQPAAVGLSETTAFRHFLESLRCQALRSTAPTFSETVDSHRRLLDDARSLIATLSSVGVRGLLRGFGDAVDASEAAMDTLVADRGAMLSRRWTEL